MSAELKQAVIARARMLDVIRDYMRARGVIEVETALFAHAPGTDAFIEPVSMQVAGRHVWAQTSPEFAMKRLLAAGCPDCYQVTKAIRDGEIGLKHHFEFLMLEYYRLGYSLNELAADAVELLGQILQLGDVEYVTYEQLYQRFLNFNPHNVSLDFLNKLLAEHNCPQAQNTLAALDILFGFIIEPKLKGTYVITHYPADAAMLAKVDEQNCALRFEIVHNGVELANGFEELCDSTEMRQRMQRDNKSRKQEGKQQMPIDEGFLAALDKMPACSGVAIGLDRLLMLQLGVNDIAKVRPFIADVR